METFWQQSERTFVIAVKAAAERQRRDVHRDRILAYNIAKLAGFSKVPPFEECFPPEHEGAGTPGADAVLGRLLSLKSKGVAMTVEKVTLH